MLLEYKPEIKETSVKDTQNMQDINFNILSQKNTGEVKKLIVKNLKDQELIGATITSKEGINATLSINSIGKMISDKAIQKSLDNGFSREEHLKAVLDIRPLFENAIRRESTQDKKGNGLIIHRLESNIDEKSLALITLKESQQHGRKIYTIELQLSPKSTSPSTPLNTKADLGEIPSQETKGGQNAETPIGYSADIIPQNPTKAQSEYFNPFMNEYEKIKEIKKLHTQDDNLIRVMKVEGRNDYIEPLSNMSVSKEYLQKQTAQSLKENITQAILGNQTQLKALQQGYNTYHLSHFQKEVLESALDIANNPTKLKEYKLQGLQKQLNNLNNNEAYHIEKGREYDKARYAKDRQELEKEIYALKGTESSTQINKDSVMLSGSETSHLNGNKDVLALPQHDKGINQYDKTKETFTDSYGKTHEIPKDIAQAWKNTFNLQSLDEAYIPSFTPEVKQALDSILQGEDIKLYAGSLVKLIKENRLKYLDRIKPTLEQPQRIILQNDGALIFARNFGEEKYFTSVARNDNGEWIIRSNAPKAENGLNNKISAGGKEIYNSQAVNQINAHNPYDDIAKSNIKLDNNIIPQQTLESTMQKFNYDEKKAKDLLEWHKDSSPLTKDENGLPKVFYHGTTLSNMKRLHKELKKPFEVFNTKDNSVSNFSIGNWFSNDKNLAKNYADDDEGNFIYEVFLNIKKPFIMEKELTQEKIKEIDKIFKFTKKDKERGLRAVENLKQAKAELKESGFEFLQYDRESVKIRHIESGKEFSTPLYNLKKEDLHESIRAYEADLKHNPNLDESLQELKELDSLLKKDSPTLYEAGFEKEFFKNETELYILAAARENEKLQEVVGGHYGVYGGYGIMYKTARIYPLQQFYKKAGYDGILFNDREIVAFDSNQIKHIDNKGSHTDTKGNITKTKPKNKESTHTYFNENSPNIMYANPSHLGSGLISGSVAGIETDENGNIVGFNPAKFAAGFLGGVVGSKAVMSGKYAIMRRMEARKNDKNLIKVLENIDSSVKYGSKMNLIGKENLNADTLAYALAKNKRFAINKLDSKTAKELGFKYPQDVRRSINPSDVIHTLNRHGIDSNLVKLSGQKPVTLDDIAKYQDYADNATHKGVSKGKRQESVSVSANQLDSEFYVIIEQIRKGQNELGFKTMYFERGILDDEKFNKLLKK